MTVHFGWFLGVGFGVQGWGDAAYGVGYDWKRPRVYQDAARTFEASGLDVLVIEDGVAVPDTYRGTAEVNLAAARFVPKHDPVVLVPPLLAATERIGIVPTLSASFTPPYTAARLLATLGHFADGRLGVNIVTSGSDLAAQNYGLAQQTEHDERYDRADEWLDVVRALWRSWEPGAIVEDPVRGVYADHTKVRPIHHEGRYFRVRGPLNALPPDEEPVIVQAGASGRGRDFAGANADVVLALASTPERMRQHRDDIRAVAAAAGRDADAIRVLFVVNPIPTGSDEEAAEVVSRRAELTQAAIDEQLQSISYLTNTDFARFDLDAPLPAFETNSNRGTLDNFVQSAPAGSTLREILAARAKRDGLAIVGRPARIADRLGELAEGSGADGFLFTGPVHPQHVHRTLDPLVPALRDAGLLRSELSAAGLRTNLAAF